MSKIGYLIILVLILIIAFLLYLKFPRKTNRNIVQKISNQNFTLEIADTTYLQAKGLSNRQQLCSDCGMLFIFKSEKIQTFWMKDTLLPLDIIFINANYQITDIYTANPEPNKSDFQLTLYQSTTPTKYVIELNAGTSQKINLKVGDTINLNEL